MANYGIGGRYTPHTDYSLLADDGVGRTALDRFRGDRILTFMTYVSCPTNKNNNEVVVTSGPGGDG